MNSLKPGKKKWNTISTRVEKEVLKAININNVIDTDKKGKLIEIRKESDLKKVHAVILPFRHQKQMTKRATTKTVG